MKVSGRECPIDFCWSGRRIIQVNLSKANWSGHVTEDMKVSVSKRMMEESFSSLKGRGRTANNVNDWNVFRKTAGNSIESRELSDACTKSELIYGVDLPKVVMIALSPLTRA